MKIKIISLIVIIILGISACKTIESAEPNLGELVTTTLTPEPIAAEKLIPTPTHEPVLISFKKSEQTFDPIPTWKIGLADLDGDDDLDAVFANSLANASQVWLNDGSGFLFDSGQEFGSHGHGVDVGDVDNDGDLDIVLTTHEFVPTRVYLNDGGGTYDELEGAFEETTGHSVDLYDLDGDSDLDAVGEIGTGSTRIFWNDGGGKFTASDISFPRTTTWGDLDGDGDIDLLLKENKVGYSVHLNDSQGSFSQYSKLADPQAMNIGGMTLGDIDHDGDLDAVVTNGFHRMDSYPGMVLLNDGTGKLADSGQRLDPVTDAGVSLGDLDNDGDLDLVLTDYLNPCQIWLNDGSGAFQDSGFRFGSGQFYTHALLGDLDGDDDLDIFLSTFGMDQGPNEIWFNQLLGEPGST
ncbi:MAG: VCBS repeat-containing protein [Anaerolineales bacterium]|nr:VCBS repeat-containing protein [Anaerolineales bacterium]